MKKLLAAGALALMAMAGSAQAAPVITYTGGAYVPPANTAVFQNFDSFAAGTMLGNNTFVKNATDALGAKPAYGSTGNFAAVYNGGSYSVAFGPTSVFSFLLGSLDAFNSLTLRFTDGTSTTYVGGQITNDASYNSGSRTDLDTNGTVAYTVTSGPLINGATFTSTGDSFEFDNLGAAVPEPAMWGMMILGFGLVGGALRRRPSTAKLRFA